MRIEIQNPPLKFTLRCSGNFSASDAAIVKLTDFSGNDALLVTPTQFEAAQRDPKNANSVLRTGTRPTACQLKNWGANHPVNGAA